jgi:hypothetical protein
MIGYMNKLKEDIKHCMDKNEEKGCTNIVIS